MGRSNRILSLSVFAISLLLPAASVLAADVLPGYDLFETTTGTNLMGIPLMGVPLGTFDFGSGPVNVGDTDTIVQRLSTATPPSLPGTAPTISTQMLALDMETVTPTNLGAGVNNYFVTLQSAHGGPATTGTLDISFDAAGDGGTFNSTFDVFYDIRVGSLTGPIVASSNLTLTGTDNSWNRIAPPGSVAIPGIDYLLNGNNTTEDFWPVPPVTESEPGVGVHVVTPAPMPEPASLSLLAVGGLAALLRRRR
jgi:hypothetical protein